MNKDLKDVIKQLEEEKKERYRLVCALWNGWHLSETDMVKAREMVDNLDATLSQMEA
jgi:thymidylate synthase